MKVLISILILFSLAGMSCEAPTGSIGPRSKLLGEKGVNFPNTLLCHANGRSFIAGYGNEAAIGVEAKGKNDAFLLALDELLDTIWVKSFGGSGNDAFTDVIELLDGNLLAVGYQTNANGFKDILSICLNAEGHVQWQITFGGNKDDEAFQVVQAHNGSIYLGGFSSSNDLTADGNKGGNDGLVAQLDLSGKVKWIKSFGGQFNDFIVDAVVVDSTRLAFGGFTGSPELATGNQGARDSWLLLLDRDGNKISSQAFGTKGQEDITAMAINAKKEIILVGTSFQNGANEKNKYGFMAKTDANGMLITQIVNTQPSVFFCAEGNGDEFILGGHATADTANHKSAHFWNAENTGVGMELLPKNIPGTEVVMHFEQDINGSWWALSHYDDTTGTSEEQLVKMYLRKLKF